MTVPEGQVALALAELRQALEVGFARIDGQLALLVQRSDQTDKALEDLEERVSALEKTRWPLPTVAVLASVTAVVLTVFSLARG
ncbi:hypothetical protein ACFY9G_08870 [Streptomyces anthocyanicus]|jgi:hypothetical protein|uniref:hypothetical protein n=1 Tax=Streptomyces anthocyanicus TaxID=68174 RepID=UPI0036E1E48E